MVALTSREIDRQFFRIMMLVKKRPGMYLYPISIDSLRNFISGYTASLLGFDIEKSRYFGFKDSFFDWMVSKLGGKISPSASWVTILKDGVCDDNDAFFRFFEYLEEFESILDKE